jgi:hypothetical protein
VLAGLLFPVFVLVPYIACRTTTSIHLFVLSLYCAFVAHMMSDAIPYRKASVRTESDNGCVFAQPQLSMTAKSIFLYLVKSPVRIRYLYVQSLKLPVRVSCFLPLVKLTSGFESLALVGHFHCWMQRRCVIIADLLSL